MLTLRRRLLAFTGLLVLLLVACGLLYLALQLRNGWWLLGAVVAFLLLVVLWVRTVVAVRRSARRTRPPRVDPDEELLRRHR